MLLMDDSGKHRIYRDQDGREFVSVTSSIKLIGELLKEPDDYAGVPSALLRMHSLEGTACHAICLDFLAAQAGWLSGFTVPSWPAYDHPDEARWKNILCNALKGFQEWAERRIVEPLAIEKESSNAAYGIAGRPDLSCILEWRKRRLEAVVDLKFVRSLQRSSEMQLRLYSKLDLFKGASLGLIVRIDRETGTVQEREVYLDQRPEDTAAALCATQLYRWAINNRS